MGVSPHPTLTYVRTDASPQPSPTYVQTRAPNPHLRTYGREPPTLAAHRNTTTANPPFQPINDAGFTEVFASVDFVACPHDGAHDEQYGFAFTLACTTADAPPNTTSHNLRSMVFLLGDVRIRLPFAHMSCCIWRPSPARSQLQRE